MRFIFKTINLYYQCKYEHEQKVEYEAKLCFSYLSTVQIHRFVRLKFDLGLNKHRIRLQHRPAYKFVEYNLQPRFFFIKITIIKNIQII